MSDLNSNTFSAFNVFPKYVVEDSLKRAKVQLPNGDIAIRMTGDIVVDPEVSLAPVTDALGETTDTSSSNTVIGLLKNIASSSGSGTDVTNIEEVLGTKTDIASDGTISGLNQGIYDKLTAINSTDTAVSTIIADTLGESTDTDSANSVIGLLKNIKSTNTQNLSGITAPLGTTSDAYTDNTIIGLLKDNKVQTGQIRGYDNSIANAVGSHDDTVAANTVIGLLKSINNSGGGPSITPITDALGETTDTTSDDTVIGLLKRMISRV